MPTRKLIRINEIGSFTTLVVSAEGYLCLRIFHNKKLYEEAIKIAHWERNGFLCIGQVAVPMRNVLLCTPEESMEDSDFKKAALVIQSGALLHVKLTSFRGSLIDSPKRLDLYSQPMQNDPVEESGKESHAEVDSCGPLPQVDVVVNLVREDLPVGVKWDKWKEEFFRELNGFS